MAGGIDELTDGQRECLRLVLSHHSSKEIAAQLGVSPSAVDKRIERAVQTLGAGSRFAAARRLAAGESGTAYDRLPSDPIDIPPPLVPDQVATQDRPWGLARRLVGISPAGRDIGAVRNPLTGPQRLLLVFGLVVAIAVTSLVLVNVATTLSDLVGPWRSRAIH